MDLETLRRRLDTALSRHPRVALDRSDLVSAAVLSALDLPVLPYLDLNALWLGVFLTCGRCGCLMVGCWSTLRKTVS